MGNVIDTERTDQIYRCNNVKLTNIYISLIGTPISLTFLLLGIFRMFFWKKKISYLTKIIILIFTSEVINCLSKLIQLLKYTFEDLRNDKTSPNYDTPRGVICQIQIVSSMYSDFCTLFSSLLLSLRCYDVIKNKNRFFDKGRNGIFSLIFIICISTALSIIILFIDRNISDISYRYDVRDRCSYWCWLYHTTSMICFGLYWIFIILNLVFACKTVYYLKSGYKKLLEEYEINSKSNSLSTPLNDTWKEKYSKNGSNEAISEKKIYHLSEEEKKRINEIHLMKMKCLIYPWVTNIIWLFAATYRIADTIFMWDYDNGDNPDNNEEEEKHYFENAPVAHFFVQFFLVLHTLLSSTRGIFYAFSFIVFEEKLFFNFFRRCFKNNDIQIMEEEEEIKEINRNTDFSDYNKNNNTDNDEEKRYEEEKSYTNEMNSSDYHYNENDQQ